MTWLAVSIRVPYYIGDRKRDPNLENYPFRVWLRTHDRAPKLLEGPDDS